MNEHRSAVAEEGRGGERSQLSPRRGGYQWMHMLARSLACSSNDAKTWLVSPSLSLSARCYHYHLSSGRGRGLIRHSLRVQRHLPHPDRPWCRNNDRERDSGDVHFLSNQLVGGRGIGIGMPLERKCLCGRRAV